MSRPSKHIYDPDFKYVPAFETDIRKTFKALRKSKVKKSELAKRKAVRQGVVK